jgi:hypothetical protein
MARWTSDAIDDACQRILEMADRLDTLENCTIPPPEPPKPASRWGAISTLLVMIGAPFVVLFVDSPIGWLFYLGGAIAGIIHFARRDRAMLAQFMYYLVMNVIAILVRVIV